MNTRGLRAAAFVLIVLGLASLFLRPTVREIVISKSSRTLTAYTMDGDVLGRFPIGLGRDPLGPKEREGDERTPEGDYTVCFKNPESRFHLSLGLSYPNPVDAERGLAAGLIGEEEYRAISEAYHRGEIPPWKTPLGGEIFIHGGLERYDATAGCVAVHRVRGERPARLRYDDLSYGRSQEKGGQAEHDQHEGGGAEASSVHLHAQNM
ncbi:MAG: L,D-transpeptidase family protein, partial [Candidatus Binatia bacterium]